ncbi:hypothetical protein GCM10009861_01430 [Neomicrococcus aestuarii]
MSTHNNRYEQLARKGGDVPCVDKTRQRGHEMRRKHPKPWPRHSETAPEVAVSAMEMAEA